MEQLKSYNFKNSFGCFVNKRLQNKQKLNKEEIDRLLTTIKEKNINDKDDYQLINKIKKLLLLSRNEFKYNEYINYCERNFKDLTETEYLECISIFVEYIPEVLNEELLEELIVQYLSFDSNRILLKEYLDKHKDKLVKYEYLIKLINYNYNDILYEILKLLELDNIDIDYFSKLVDKMYVLNSKYKVQTINISLLKKVMNKLSNEEFLYSVEYKRYLELKNKLLEKIYMLLSNEQKNKLVRVDMMNNKINIHPTFNIKKEDIYFEKLPLYTNSYIVTIDDKLSEDLDGAFSIKKIDDIYFFDVYISDVPSYIIKNNELFNEAYNRGCSLYLTNEDKTRKTIDMIPPVLSHKYLSLITDYPKNVIKFSFLFSNNGVLYSCGIERVKTYINKNITPEQAQLYMDNKSIRNNDTYTLYLLKQLAYILKNNTEYSLIREINPKKIESLLALPSLLVNYYIGSNSEFAIYKENGIYTRYNEGIYTPSSTPIRKFASDINLMFFLNQKNIVLYPNKKLYWIKDNIDDVIMHLNERDIISKFASSNSEFVKKYIKY